MICVIPSSLSDAFETLVKSDESVFGIYHQADQLIHHTYYANQKSNSEDIDDS